MCCVLTYDHPHRKTQDLLSILKLKGYEVFVVGTPWIEKKIARPLLEHKPGSKRHIKDVCSALGYSYEVSGDLLSYFNVRKPELVLVGAAGILPEDVVRNFTIINSHPGYLPYCRGLDALKWSLYEDLPVGVTTHILDKNVDMGRLIRRVKTPIGPDNAFGDIARRHYDLEVSLLADAAEDIKNAPRTELSGTESRIHGRMPRPVEIELKRKLDKIYWEHSEKI